MPFGDPTEAAKWYARAAELGHVESQLTLAERYADGIGVGRNYGRSAELLQLAAESGNAEAQFQLGDRYTSNVKGVFANREKARELFLQAAGQDHVDAMNSLGTIYFTGWGVPVDGAEGLKWLLGAAEHDHAQAERRLANVYLTGNTVEQDIAAGRVWLLRAGVFAC